ncbi:MAG: DEAD/DEAH box helicase, partial [Thermoleophilia bacterium]|nr:DEAD/DEAH box helicase [Thermoleophilia bacterium]
MPDRPPSIPTPPPIDSPPAAEVLARLHPAVRDWFIEQFAEPTEVQLRGWHSIARGDHTLLGAPTGSGKTLAAFLYSLSELTKQPVPDRTHRLRVVYVSPLRALNYDIERNLVAPLTGIVRTAGRLGLDVPAIVTGVRTGDTPQSERRKQVKHSVDILITTPESLYVMLTTGARELFAGVQTVIVDEIHALASSKRGTHMSWTLERLALRTQEANG